MALLVPCFKLAYSLSSSLLISIVQVGLLSDVLFNLHCAWNTRSTNVCFEHLVWIIDCLSDTRLPRPTCEFFFLSSTTVSSSDWILQA